MDKSSGIVRLDISVLNEYMCLYRVIMVLLVDVMPEVVRGVMRLVC